MYAALLSDFFSMKAGEATNAVYGLRDHTAVALEFGGAMSSHCHIEGCYRFELRLALGMGTACC